MLSTISGRRKGDRDRLLSLRHAIHLLPFSLFLSFGSIVGYQNPILWLSPLGGWTKKDDVPLDVRVKQHVAVLNEGMLDPKTTVMAIWPAPMIYAGPTEVIFHAKSRRNAGAGFFVVGRDPAGMKGSIEAATFKEEDLYHPDHGRYVLQTSPGLGEMELVAFQQVKYDKRDHTMKTPDPKRPVRMGGGVCLHIYKFILNIHVLTSFPHSPRLYHAIHNRTTSSPYREARCACWPAMVQCRAACPCLLT